jgi:Photosynthetic reaction centre cytochrome C subunit
MNRLLRYCVPVLCAGLMPILSTGQNTPPAAAPGAPPAARAPQKPKNLKVLPDDTDLRKVMRQFSGDLGVECEFCHAAADPVTHRADRASDANPVKDKARYMIQMTSDLNTKYLAGLSGRHYADPITCGTCHRGEKHPSVFVAPPRQEGNRPPGMQPGAPPAAGPQAPPPGN